MSDYQQTLDWIYSFANWETRTSAGVTPPDWDLARMEKLLAAAGNPHQRYPTVHVAGTKGKGSTVAMLASILQAAGYRTGVYTSPHLHTFRERIRVDGEMIGEEELGELAGRFRPLAAAIPGLTTFEVVTAMAFAYFAAREVDEAVIEVGLGGRLDATNVITPRVSVITSLSLDHTALLGNTLAAIAGEKAGIIKPGVPVVVAPQPAEALSVVARVAREKNAPLVVVGRDWKWQPGEISLDGQAVEVERVAKEEMPAGTERNEAGTAPTRLRLRVPLLGRHQLLNATTAVATLDVLRSQGIDISDADIRDGLAATRWPGRLEILSRRPLLVVDGAHNAESAQRLVEALREWFGARPRWLVFGASFDKDIGGMLDVLIPGSEAVILAHSRHPRHTDLQALAAEVTARGGRVEIGGGVGNALRRGLDLAGADDLVFVTGSLFVVAEAREAWLAWSGGPMPEADPPPPAA